MAVKDDNGEIIDSGESSVQTTRAVSEGQKGAPVTTDDLALREDICCQIFGDVGLLVRDFSCAWDHKVLMHGRMYVTERRLCFYANFFGLEAKMSLRHQDVERCNKGNSAIFIPNTIVVQDKSGKDFVFRNFWERDECHSLLENLRRKAQAEEELEIAAARAAAEAEAGTSLGEEGNKSWNNKKGGAGRQQDTSSPSPERTRAANSPAALPRESSSSSEASARHRRSPSPPPGDSRPSSVPPPRRARTRSTTISMLPCSLPSSPNSAPRTRSASLLVPASSSSSSPAAAAAAAVVVGSCARRPTNLGLAVVGGEHDVPSPRALYGGSAGGSGSGMRRHYSAPRPVRSPRRTAVITGAGRGGWGSPEPAKLVVNGSSSGSGGDKSRVGLDFNGAHHSNAAAAAADDGSDDYASPDVEGRGTAGSPLPPLAAACAGARENGVANDAAHVATPSGSMTDGRRRPRRDHAVVTGEAESSPGVSIREEAAGTCDVADGGDDLDEDGGGDAPETGGGDGHRPGKDLKRRGSKLWNIINVGGGGAGAGAENDPKADRQALEKAIASAGNHSEVATAELAVPVREFYERFFADDAPYGLPDFHASRGDWEVDADEWQQTTEGDEGSATAGASGGGGGGGWAAGGGGLTRAVRFKTPLHITFMSSPGQVRTLKRQRVRFFGREGCVLETITTVEDRIPLSDNFHVEDRWIIRPAGKDGRACTATVTWRCVWHKFTVIKGLIEGKARADVKSFNVAFLEGMRVHLLEAQGTKALKRRPSLRESLLLTGAGGGGAGGGRRASRDGSFSARSRMSSFDLFEDGKTRTPASVIDVEDERSSKTMARLLDRYLPAIRVFSICFVLYIAVFWMQYQMRGGGGGDGGTGWGRGAMSEAATKEELMRLYGEWGRSSLALLDVREETRRLATEVSRFGGFASRGRGGDGGARSRGRSPSMEASSREDEMMMQHFLREIEEKVAGISQRADVALAALNETASQIRDATACPTAENCPPCEVLCLGE